MVKESDRVTRAVLFCNANSAFMERLLKNTIMLQHATGFSYFVPPLTYIDATNTLIERAVVVVAKRSVNDFQVKNYKTHLDKNNDLICSS